MKLLQFQKTVERVLRGRKLVKEQAQAGSALRIMRYGGKK